MPSDTEIRRRVYQAQYEEYLRRLNGLNVEEQEAAALLRAANERYARVTTQLDEVNRKIDDLVELARIDGIDLVAPE